MRGLDAYIPQDRRRALALQIPLPDRAEGAVLFADISGFTPLTEAFTRGFGTRRGAEELTRQLNAVYDALLVAIENYGGSVISFAGDAALCWFAKDTGAATPAARALACAFALQHAMQQFAAIPLPDRMTTELAIKVIVTFGTVRRFVVGDAHIRIMDVIAGKPVTRSGIAEHLAQRGEILVDEITARELDAQIEIHAWRSAPAGIERFAVVRAFHAPILPPPPPAAPAPSQDLVKPWLHDAVYKHLSAKDETFLTELRPVVALFARFQGIDFETDDDAGEKLNRFVTRAQQILDGYGGALLELTVGDKGSYFYATFGAPHIHEDDARRAVLAARELFPLCRALGFIEPLQIGISQGIMRVGAYGSRTRRTYGAQGDEVNLAARLMMEAEPGTLLVSGRIQKNVANEFDLEPLPPILLKGKAEPLLPFLVVGMRETRVKQLQEAYYALPMIGRETELALIQAKIELARRGHGQIIALTAPAGIGKSRMTAEIIRTVRRRRESSYSGECQSFGVNISYLVWGPVLRAFFGVDTNLPLRRQIRALENEIAELAPERVNALPLLGEILDLPVPENDFTRALEPEFRKTALHALLRECVAAAAEQARAQGQAILFVLEDLHWIDPASRELLQDLAAHIENLPVVFLLNYRPTDTESFLLQIQGLPFFTRLVLAALTDAQGEDLIRAKLAQHAPEATDSVPRALIERVTAQAQGNPFYIEQLLDYIHDRGLDFRSAQDTAALELPNTLHRLVLSRLEQLTEQQQLTLQAASIIGRWFSHAHLCGYFPALGSPEQVRADLTLLLRYDLTALDRPDPDLAYVFKHVVTHQVAYEALAFATRAKLHEAYAQFLERHNEPERVLDLLAYHYDRSDNLPKRLAYLTRAGQAAAARFANAEAVDYLTRALALTTNKLAERYALLSARARVFEVQGLRDAQRADLEQLEQLTNALDDPFRHLSVLLEQGWLAERIADHETARQILERFQARLEGAALPAAQRQPLAAEAQLLQGVMFWQQGQLTRARSTMEHAAQLFAPASDATFEARLQSFLGTVLRELGDLARARECFIRQLTRARENGDRRREWAALNNLGLTATEEGAFVDAESLYTEALQIVRTIGDYAGEGYLWSNLALPAIAQGEYQRALADCERALVIYQAISDRRGICRVTLQLGEVYRLVGTYDIARTYNENALRLALEIADRLSADAARMNLAAIALAQKELARAIELSQNALPSTRENHHREGEAFLLNTLGQAQLALGELAAAQESFTQASAIWQTLEPSPYSLQSRAGLAEIALQQNDFAPAANECNAIFEFLRAHPNRQGDPSALSALFTCYRVLSALNDAHARAVLDDAYAQLQTRAEKIDDAPMRQSFLENVPANAEIVRAWNAIHS